MKIDRSLDSLNLLVLLLLICCATLSLLTIVTGYAQSKLALKQTDLALGNIECANQGRQWVAQLQQEAPQDESESVTKTFTDSQGHQLTVTVQWQDKTLVITGWDSETIADFNHNVNVLP